jgi:hypothetical protein
LKKIKDEYTILSLLSGTKESLGPIYVWKLVGAYKHLGQARIESLRKNRNDFCIVPSEGQDKIVQDLIIGNSNVDLYIPDSSLVFRCAVKTIDAPSRYYLHMPDFVAQVERRKGFRLNVHESSEVKVNFSKALSLQRLLTQHFTKECFDLGSGGFSFFVSKMEAKFFSKNDKILSIDLRAGNWGTKLDAEVAMVREVVPDQTNGLSYKVWRVSCRFTSIDEVRDDLHAINE